MINGFKNFLSSVKFLIRLFLIGVLIFFISRVLFLFAYGDLNQLSNSILDILLAFVNGLRYDIKVLAFGLLPLAFLSITQLINNRKSLAYGFYYKTSLYYGLFVLTIFTLITVIDFYFYKFFNTRISVLFFGIVEDDTSAVIKSIWTDYPVVLITISLIIWAVLLYILIKWLFKKEIKWVYIQSPFLKTVCVFLFLGIYFLGLRGTIGMVPLDIRHSTISKNTFINSLTLNGVFALKTAYSDKKSSKIDTDIPKMLKKYNFRTPEEAVSTYLGKSINDSISLSDNLLATTPKDSFLTSNPPNVVFILMESMNSYYFDLNSKEVNVLGNLEKVLPDCYLFRNFLSAGNLTIFSLEGILAGTPLAPISQSVYQNRSLSSSVAKPFKDNGYETSFITGGEMGWRSLDKFIYHQYFDNVEGKPTLKKLYPNASYCEWGVHDEYTFDRIFKILKNTNGKPKFVVGFTISNHTPYEPPKTYKPYPLTLSQEIISRLKANPEIAYKNLLSYQYANSCLGNFIDSLRHSPLGDNTIVVATGDHTNNLLFEFTDRDMLKKYSIPLIIYVPEKYRPKHKVNTEKFSSHKDIFPTIFNLALSNAKYLKTGVDLLSDSTSYNYGVYNFMMTMDSVGCVSFQRTPLYFKWEDNSAKQLTPIDVGNNPHLDSLYLKARSYIASMKYYIMNELKSKKVGE